MTTSFTKTRPDDVLGNLSHDQQEQILDWLDADSYREVLRKIEAPAPDGFGLKIHYTTLRRFYQKHLPRRLFEARKETLGDWQSLADEAESHPSPFKILAREALQKQVFLMLLQPERYEKQILPFLRTMTRWITQEHAEKKWLHQMEKERRAIAEQEANRRAYASFAAPATSAAPEKSKNLSAPTKPATPPTGGKPASSPNGSTPVNPNIRVVEGPGLPPGIFPPQPKFNPADILSAINAQTSVKSKTRSTSDHP